MWWVPSQDVRWSISIKSIIIFARHLRIAAPLHSTCFLFFVFTFCSSLISTWYLGWDPWIVIIPHHTYKRITQSQHTITQANSKILLVLYALSGMFSHLISSMQILSIPLLLLNVFHSFWDDSPNNSNLSFPKAGGADSPGIKVK